MTVSVDIEVARRANAVLVPGDALHDADTASPWVLKLDGRARAPQPCSWACAAVGWPKSWKACAPATG